MAEWHLVPMFKDRGDSFVGSDVLSDASVFSGWYLPPVKQEYGDVTDYDASGSYMVSSSPLSDSMDTVYSQTMDCDTKGMLPSPVATANHCLRNRSASVCPPNPANSWRPAASPPTADCERKERQSPPSAIPKNSLRARSASVCYATTPWKVNATSPIMHESDKSGIDMYKNKIPRSMSPQLSSPTKSFKLLSRALSTIHETIKQRLRDVITKPEASNISVDKKMRDLCQYYMTLIPCDRATFLKTLAADFAVDHSLVLYLANNLSIAQERGATILLKCEERLRHALIPRYQQLFTQISRLESGVKFLVDMRTDLLNILMPGSILHDDPYVQTMNSCLRDLLSLWFSVGFLTLERITWQSSCDILQKISEYEAVHPIRNWTDLKRRVGPYRRCFIFTHKSMPREPVVVLHTALTDSISQSIQMIVEDAHLASETDSEKDESSEESDRITTVMFYSITSTQKGLQGVEMGNYLIKSVVQEMLAEFPKMQNFSSLSPIPGFKDWLVGEISKYLHQHDIGEDPTQTLFTNAELSELRNTLYSPSPEKPTMACLKDALQKNSWGSNEGMVRVLKTPLLRNCAHYLYTVKRRCFAYNPVAHFHLRNGAVMWRLNWRADTSPRGISVSCGIMVNYRYFLEEAEENSSEYMEKHIIAASQQFLELIQDISKHSEAKPLNS